MKIEIEISENDIKEHLEKYCKNGMLSAYSSSSFRTFLDTQTKKTLERTFVESNYLKIIDERCAEIALNEIEKAAATKVPGWVKQQMKEMLKYARASFWKENGRIK